MSLKGYTVIQRIKHMNSLFTKVQKANNNVKNVK